SPRQAGSMRATSARACLDLTLGLPAALTALPAAPARADAAPVERELPPRQEPVLVARDLLEHAVVVPALPGADLLALDKRALRDEHALVVPVLRPTVRPAVVVVHEARALPVGVPDGVAPDGPTGLVR